LLWAWLYRAWPRCLKVMVLVKPATVIHWHRQGFRRYWRWRSRSERPGRPGVNREVRDLIRQMSREKSLGCTMEPRRVANAWNQSRSINRGQVYGQAPLTTVARLENFPAQSRWRRRFVGSVRRTHYLVQTAVRLADPASRPQAASKDQRH